MSIIFAAAKSCKACHESFFRSTKEKHQEKVQAYFIDAASEAATKFDFGVLLDEEGYGKINLFMDELRFSCMRCSNERPLIYERVEKDMAAPFWQDILQGMKEREVKEKSKAVEHRGNVAYIGGAEDKNKQGK